jgi:hypothetical protein
MTPQCNLQSLLENAKHLAANADFSMDTKLFPAEQLPFREASFDLVATRVAPHHSSSPGGFVNETAPPIGSMSCTPSNRLPITYGMRSALPTKTAKLGGGGPC